MMHIVQLGLFTGMGQASSGKHELYGPVCHLDLILQRSGLDELGNSVAGKKSPLVIVKNNFRANI